MENKGSLTYLQKPATSPYPEPHQSSRRLPIQIHEDRFNIFVPSKTRSSKLALSLRFPHHDPVCTSPLSHTRASRLAHIIVVDLFNRMLFGEATHTMKFLIMQSVLPFLLRPP